MKSKVVVAIVGESGSGKSTLVELLEQELEVKSIDSFTTRKPRYKNEKGHIFTNLKQYECNKANRQIVAETYFDGNYYWTTRGQFNESCIYIIDPAGIKILKENIKDAEIIVIYLKADRKNRFIRMSARDTTEKVVERLKHDDEAFKIIPSNFVIDANRSVKEVFKDVKEILSNIL